MDKLVTVRKPEQSGGVCVIELGGEIDVFASPVVKAALVDLVREGNVLLAVDLARVSYIDSTGLGALITALKDARERRGAVAVACANAQIRRIFEVTGLVKVFGMYDAVEPACAALREKFVAAP